jgi:hypothetical protein
LVARKSRLERRNVVGGTASFGTGAETQAETQAEAEAEAEANAIGLRDGDFCFGFGFGFGFGRFGLFIQFLLFYFFLEHCNNGSSIHFF